MRRHPKEARNNNLCNCGAAFKLRADLSALFGMGCSIARGRLKPASRMNPAPQLHRLLLRVSLAHPDRPNRLWFQLYAAHSEETNRELVETAVAAGCRTVALTEDGLFRKSTVEKWRHRKAVHPCRE